MVAKLPLPRHDSIELIETINQERIQHADFFKLMKDDWVAQVLSYQENRGTPCILNPLDLSSYISDETLALEEGNEARPRESEDALTRLLIRRKNSVKGLYKPTKDKELYQTLDTLRNKHKLNYCPCCGSPGKPTTLDHYLPQSIFPEFSIVFENLTPMCSKCNELKKNNIKDKNGNRLFLHPYYDPMNEVQLELTITPPYGSPSSFIAEVPDLVPEPFRTVIMNHIGQIEFVNRLEEACITEYADLIATLHEEKQKDVKIKVKSKIEDFYNLAKQRSTNKWMAIYYRGILRNIDLLNFLENEDLSEYLEET